MTTLKQAAAGRWLTGVALSPIPSYAADELALAARHFDAVVPENHMKPSQIQPEPGRFTWNAADAIVAWAESQGMTLTGHTLLWHTSCPDWFFEDGGRTAGRDLVLARMRTHIAALVGRYRGRIRGWDVVNEALSDHPPEYLRRTKWLECIGEDYLIEAFRAAHAADPGAELYYNDYGIEWPERHQRCLRLLRSLQAAGCRLDAVGIQGHWELDKIPLADTDAAISAFAALGLKVMITELDIDVVPRSTAGAEAGVHDVSTGDPYRDGLPDDVQKRLAEQYAAVFRLFDKHRQTITRVTWWGLHDGRSWLNLWPRTRTNHAMPFDRRLQPKPAFHAIADALANGPASTHR